MRTIIVGLWSCDTTKHSASPTPAKMQHLKDAAAKVTSAIAAAKVPDKQDIRGILIAPEYFFTKAQAGTWSGTAFIDRSLTPVDVQTAIKEFETLSKANNKVLMVPGTVAWKKPLIRPLSENRKFSSLTQDRSGPLKATSRLDGAKQSLTHDKTATGEKMGGGRLASRNLQNVIFNYIMDPANAGWFAANRVWFASRGVPITDPDKLYQLFLRDDNLLDEIAPLGVRAPHISVIPKLDDKIAALATATSMMRNTAFVLLNGKVRFKYNKQGDFHEAIGGGGSTVFIPGAKAGVATIGAIRFGFEICLDHALGYLGRVGTTNPLPGLQREPRDIHIVTSAAVMNNTANMYVRPGGYFLHASTNAGCTCVYHNQPPAKNDPGGLKPMASFAKHTINGDELQLFKIELPNFGLAGV